MASTYASPPTSPPTSPLPPSAAAAMRSPIRSPPSSVASSAPYSPAFSDYSRSFSDHSDDYEAIEVVANDENKSSTVKHKERGAAIRALRLLDQEIAGERHKTISPVPPTPQSIRQAAIARYEEERRARKLAEAKLKEDIEFNRPKPKLVVPKRPERMAETTRHVPKRPEDVLDPETVAGMKCQLDLDRQKYAQNMALELVQSKYGQETSIV